MNKNRRLLAARMLHLGCSISDTIRVTTWMDAVLGGGLTEKEARLVKQRMRQSKKMVDDIRVIANRIERNARR